MSGAPHALVMGLLFVPRPDNIVDILRKGPSMQELSVFIANHLGLAYGLLFAIGLLMVVEYLRLKRNTFSINVPKAVHLINRENAVIIDVRAPEAYQKGHIIDSYSIPVKDLETTPKKLDKFRTKPIIVVCGTGQESQKIATLYLKQGYNIYSLSGGIRAWTSAELPLVRE